MVAITVDQSGLLALAANISLMLPLTSLEQILILRHEKSDGIDRNEKMVHFNQNQSWEERQPHADVP
jgi:hypothetical protein